MSLAEIDRPVIAGLDAWLQRFAAALAANDPEAVAALFGAECYWRDLLAFTGTIRTLEGRDAIAAMIAACAASTGATRFHMGETTKPGEGWFTFETAIARGRGYLRLRDGLCWTILTASRELKGFEEKRRRSRPRGAPEPDATDRQTWLERRQDLQARLGYEQQPYVLIVGGGQGGLGSAPA